MRQDAQGARQEVPLPATPAAAALLAAREHCGARGPCYRGRAPSPCSSPPVLTRQAEAQLPRPALRGLRGQSGDGAHGPRSTRQETPTAPAAALPGLRLCCAEKFLSLGRTS